MGCRKIKKSFAKPLEKEDPVHWTVDMEFKLYKTAAPVLYITVDDHQGSKALKGC